MMLPALAILALLTGCQTPVKTEFKPDAAFTGYRTFGLIPLPQTGPVNDPGRMLRLGKPAQEAIVESLTAKGFSQADRAAADFVVNLRGQSLPKIEVSNWGYTTYARTRYGRVPVQVGPVDVQTYEERTLTIELFDNRSHELVWVGWMTKQSGGKVTPDKLKNAVHQILAKFPPTPSTAK